MSISMIALKAFSGPDGKHAKDEVFSVPAERADWLTENKYAVRATKEAVAQAAAVQAETAGAAPAAAASKPSK
jgi:hypothetical protein